MFSVFYHETWVLNKYSHLKKNSEFTSSKATVHLCCMYNVLFYVKEGRSLCCVCLKIVKGLTSLQFFLLLSSCNTPKLVIHERLQQSMLYCSQWEPFLNKCNESVLPVLYQNVNWNDHHWGKANKWGNAMLPDQIIACVISENYTL